MYQVNFLVYLIYLISESTANGSLSVGRHAVLLFSDSPLARYKMTKVQTEIQLEAAYNIHNVYKYKTAFAVDGGVVCVSQRIQLS